jgi:transcriptional regulator with XRE-family HTH domain
MDDADEFLAHVANNIRKVAERRKISLNHAADFAGMARSHLSRFLTGKSDITLRRLYRIAAALRVTPKELIDWKGEK